MSAQNSLCRSAGRILHSTCFSSIMVLTLSVALDPLYCAQHNGLILARAEAHNLVDQGEAASVAQQMQVGKQG